MLRMLTREHEYPIYFSNPHPYMVNVNSYLYDHAWRRVRGIHDTSSDLGVGIHEARHWHRRAYGGMVRLLHSVGMRF
jgi:hypothetical protein